jgi:phosphodiesterase/alkaline phosphatase D-like protein
MNRNTSIILGIIAVAAIIGFVIYQNNPSQVAVAPVTPGVTTTTTNVSTTTPTSQPAQPSAPTVTTNPLVLVSDTTAVVTGSVVPNGASTNYWYEYGTTQNLGSKISTQNVGSGFVAVASPGYITGLASDTTYYFRLVAENQYGRIAGMQNTFSTGHGNPPLVGGIPSAQTSHVGAITNTTAILDGLVTPNKAQTGYWFEYGTTPNLGYTTAFTSAGNGSGSAPVSATVLNLAPLTTYYFRINAQNQFGTVNGATLNFKTIGPAAPSAPVVSTNNASNVRNKNATLNGTVNPDGADTTYWFEYSTDPLMSSSALQTTAKTSADSGTSNVKASVSITGLTVGTNYYYRLVAQNSFGIVRGKNISFKAR